ncbi:carbohydrate ABC transporter permease [Dethiosulfatarculus sandiegensis]|uniref:carbohydrate ABC transporter permease n=1 Tax=Dethiosulfatarculus sandiegensis TaxID=1429043 RepID=UPI000696F1DC|nr:carbohydrate ABC transporter permease [Dethiosulfatarculus sandiegensis]
MPWFKSKDKRERLFWGAMKILGLAFFTILVGFPFYWMLVSSLKPLQEILMNPSNLLLDLGRISLTAYTQVLFEHGFLRYLLNSAFISLATVLLTLVLATLGGYAVTRLGFRGKKTLSGGILAIYMLPAIVLVIPLYVLLTKLGLHDSLPALVMVYLAQTLPVALYMLRSYFLTLPVELEYAAMIDGCTRLQIIRRIILPLAAPALASVALYTFMIAWNEFLFAFMLLDTPEKFTLSRGVVQLAESVHLSKQLVMAASVMTTVPIMVLFLMFERFLIQGLTKGAVKG